MQVPDQRYRNDQYGKIRDDAHATVHQQENSIIEAVTIKFWNPKFSKGHARRGFGNYTG